MDIHFEYIALLIAAVEAVKNLFPKLDGQWTTAIAILLGMAFSLGLDFLPNEMVYVINALSLGLAVPGFYSLTKRAGTAVLSR